jgi:plasmid maintenance system antidote protein VapI
MNLTKFRSVLVEEMGKQGYTLGEFALTIDVNISTLSRFFNDSRETPPDLAAKIVKTLLPEFETKFMMEYCSNLNKPKNIKIAMEYCSTHRILDVLKMLIDQGLTDRNSEVIEFAKIYNYAHKSQTQSISPKELYEGVRYEKVSYDETKVLTRLLEVYSLHQQQHYDFMLASLGELESTIQNLEDEFFRGSYMCRLAQLLMITNLKVLNKPKTARKYAKMIIECKGLVGKSYLATAYSTAGQSYMFENVDKYVKYVSKAKSIWLSLGQKGVAENVEYNLQFTKILWGINTQDDFYIDEELKAYALIKKGEIEKGLAIINALEEKDQKKFPIRSFIKGEATANVNDYWESMSLFKKRGDKFLSNLSRIRLLALGENEFVVNSLFNQ